MPGKNNRIRDKLTALIFPHLAAGLPGKGVTAPVSVKVDDSVGWETRTYAPNDRTWGEVYADLEDALEAWRKNFFIRRIVGLTRSYVVGKGLEIGSSDPAINTFIGAFWYHPMNMVGRRLGPICDALTRDGEIFPILFTNEVNGMSYVRFKSARMIREIETEPGDYEKELSYTENTPAEPKIWYSQHHPRNQEKQLPLPPLMLHWCVNKPFDATRGESDLRPVLPWALRYSEWLKDRVRLNRQRTRQGVLDVMVMDDTQVEAKKQQLRGVNPVEAGIYVHGPGEEVKMHNLNIDADEAEQDGLVLRLAIATGANLGLHYLGEGERTNYATAKEMGEPTARFFQDRQEQLIWMIEDLLTMAYERYCAVHSMQVPADMGYMVNVPEVARADNESLASAAKSMIEALALASARGWVDDETALTLAMKFAGESLSQEEIKEILTKAPEKELYQQPVDNKR